MWCHMDYPWYGEMKGIVEYNLGTGHKPKVTLKRE